MIRSYEWCVEMKTAALKLTEYVKHVDPLRLFDDKKGDFKELDALFEDMYTVRQLVQVEQDRLFGILLRYGKGGVHMFNTCYNPKGRLVYTVCVFPTMRDNPSIMRLNNNKMMMKGQMLSAPKTPKDMEWLYQSHKRYVAALSSVIHESAIVRATDLTAVPDSVFGPKVGKRVVCPAIGFDDTWVMSPSFRTYSRPRTYMTDGLITKDMVSVASGLRNNRATLLLENMKKARVFTHQHELNYIHVCIKTLQDALSALNNCEMAIKSVLFPYLLETRGEGKYVEPVSNKLTFYRGYMPVQHRSAGYFDYDALNEARAAVPTLYVNIPNVTLTAVADYEHGGRKDEFLAKWTPKHVRKARQLWDKVDWKVIGGTEDGSEAA